MNRCRLKHFRHAPLGYFQFFGQHAGLGDNRNKIGIANPSGHDMHMHMFSNASPGAMSKIHSQVESFRMIKRAQGADAALGQKHHFRSLAGVEFVDVNLSGARLEDIALTGTVIRNANCTNVTIDHARYDGMRIDGILVTDLLRVYHSRPDAL